MEDETRELTPLLLLAVFLGTALGALGRYGASQLFTDAEVPLLSGAATVVVNLLGSFGLGLLLESLTRWSTRLPAARARLLQRGLGTGLCGGFTTYSAFALDVTHPVVDAVTTGHGLPAALSSGLITIALTIVGGIVMAALGILLARRIFPPSRPPAAGRAQHVRSVQDGSSAGEEDQ